MEWSHIIKDYHKLMYSEKRGSARTSAKTKLTKTSRAFKAPVEKVNIVPFGIFGIFWLSVLIAQNLFDKNDQI